MIVNRHLAIAIRAAVALLALGLATTAHAGTRMYNGSIIIHGFGNDTTTGATPKFSKAGYTGFPGQARCNAGAPHNFETVTFPTVGAGTMTLMFTLPNYGGQVLVHDLNADGILDVPQDCFTTPVRQGKPMVASGAAAYTSGSFSDNRPASNPRKFTVAKGVFAAHVGIPPGKGTPNQPAPISGSEYGPYAFGLWYTDFSNETGTFSAGGGIGNFTWSEMDAAANRGKMEVTAGSHQFGGTMKMLGSYFSNAGFYYNGHLSVAKYTWLFQFHGAGGITSTGGGNGQTTAPGIHLGTAKIYTTLNGNRNPSKVFGKPLAWTTGTVSLTATHGPFPTVLARHGFDNRDDHGSGEVQMVTPMLTRWVWLNGNYETGSIMNIKLNFAPEPQEWLMLAAGISILGLLYRSNRRSH